MSEGMSKKEEHPGRGVGNFAGSQEDDFVLLGPSVKVKRAVLKEYVEEHGILEDYKEELKDEVREDVRAEVIEKVNDELRKIEVVDLQINGIDLEEDEVSSSEDQEEDWQEDHDKLTVEKEHDELVDEDLEEGSEDEPDEEEDDQPAQPRPFPEGDEELESFSERLDGGPYEKVVDVIKALVDRQDRVRTTDVRDRIFELYPNLDYTKQTFGEYIHKAYNHLRSEGEIERVNGTYQYKAV